MRTVLLTMTMVVLCGCGASRYLPHTDQCMAPTPKEARITKKAWM